MSPIPQTDTARPRQIRVLYVIEYLAALIAIFVMWGQVGGPSHVDPIAWQWKLGLGTSLALAVVKATEAATGDTLWNRRFVLWSIAGLLCVLGMGWLTYDQHLQEASEEEPEREVEVEKTRSFRPELRQGPHYAQLPGSAGKL
jgi:hypothetical protein